VSDGEPGQGSEAAAERRPVDAKRSVIVSLIAAAVFAALLGTYIVRSVELPVGPVLVPGDAGERPHTDTLALAQRVAGTFVDALRAGDLAGAYAQMAAPYRASATLKAFRGVWNMQLLAGPRAAKLSRAAETAVPIDGKLVAGRTFSASGALVTAAGPLDATFTFLREDDDAHILSVVVAGVPILQGFGPSAPAP
jgi:hypothetical protein